MSIVPATGQPIAEKTSEVLVLLSGGIDSSACVGFFCRQPANVTTLFVDYGQPAAPREREAAKSIASHFNVTFREIAICGAAPKGSGLYPGRNALLIFLALMECRMPAGLLTLGIHAGSEYWDCTPAFTNLAQSMIDAYCGGRVRLSLPFLHWTKREIWEFCSVCQIPVELTYSCEHGAGVPCGTCSSCKDRIYLNAVEAI